MSTIAVNAITDANDGNTTTINGVTPNSANVVGKNLIINGAMQIAQRGTSATGVSNATYPALDRWKYFLSGTTVNVSQESFSLGQTAVPEEPEFYLKNTISSNSGASDYAIVAQLIEDVRTFAGQTCTLSFWAKSSVSGNKIAIELNQTFGNGGSASTRVVTGDSDVVTLSTSWQKFSVTLTVPSISGKTIDPSTNTSFLELYLWLTGGSSWNSRASSIGNQSGDFDIALVQLEAGSSATEFEHRPYTTELQLCQRYCPAWAAVGVNNNFPFFGQAYGAGNAVYMVTYPVKPRVAATGVTTIGTFAPSASNYTIGGNFSSISIYGPNLDMFGLNCGGGSGIVAGNATAFVSTSATGLIIATGCEL